MNKDKNENNIDNNRMRTSETENTTDKEQETDEVFESVDPKLVTDGQLKNKPNFVKPVVLENTRLLNKHDETYKLETFKKKLIFIFNHTVVPGYKERIGTEHDVTAIERSFSKFDFEFRTFHDLTEELIFEELNAIKTEDFSEYGCLGIVVLTHGMLNRNLYARTSYYSEDKILSYFKSNTNPSLATKPKFLIVQACRGPQRSEAIQVIKSGILSTDGDTDGEGDTDFEGYTLPVEADILVLHSTYYGCTSYRFEDHGSWFIQELCKCIDKYADELDFYSIMVKVKNKVAINMTELKFNRATNNLQNNKQMPVTVSTLIRSFELRKYDVNYTKIIRNKESVTDLCLRVNKIEMDESVKNKDNEDKCTCEENMYNYIKYKFYKYLKPSHKGVDHVIGQAVKHGEQNNFDKILLMKMMLEEMKNESVKCEICEFIFL